MQLSTTGMGPPRSSASKECRTAGAQGRRGPRSGSTPHGHPDGHALRAAHPIFRRSSPAFGGRGWRSLGVELAGEVEAVGAAVSAVPASATTSSATCGFGAHAEFICLRESAALAHMPAGMSFEEAAAVCDGAEALALRKAGMEGKRIVIYGASGSLGTAAVQLPSTMVPTSRLCATRRTSSSVRSLGAAG